MKNVSIWLWRGALILLSIELLLVSVHLVGHLSGTHSSIIRYWFNVNQEYNIPAWFSGQQLFAVAAVWAVVAGVRFFRDGKLAWYALGLMGCFAFLSFDEIMGVHERIGTRIDGSSRRETILKHTGTWMFFLVPTGAAVFALLGWRVWRHHGRRVVMGFLTGAGVLLLAAGPGDLLENFWDGPVSHVFQTSLEEFGEMLAVTLLLWASAHALAEVVLRDEPVRVPRPERSRPHRPIEPLPA